MSLVRHIMKTDAFTALDDTINTKVAKSLNFIPVNKCDIKVCSFT